MKYVVILALLLSFLSLGLSLRNNVRLGSTVTTTASSDTLNTFLSNVNNSLTSLQNDKVSTTTAYSWTALQQFQANASTTGFSSYGVSYFGGTATSSFSTAGVLTLKGLILGTTGTSMTQMNAGTCNLLPSGTSIAASTTIVADCQGSSTGAPGVALTGIQAADRCALFLATTSPTTSDGLHLAGVSASSTQGFITAQVSNLTGASYTWTSSATSSLTYFCTR